MGSDGFFMHSVSSFRHFLADFAELVGQEIETSAKRLFLLNNVKLIIS
jgi:hypothetical protein